MDQVKNIQENQEKEKGILEDHTKRVEKDIVMDQVRDILEDHTKRVEKDIVMDQVRDILHLMDLVKAIMVVPRKVVKARLMDLVKVILDVPTEAMFIEKAIRKFKITIS